MRTPFFITVTLSFTIQFLGAQVPRFAISTYAAGPSAVLPIPGLNAAIGSPQSIATDFVGNIYFTSLIADSPANYHGRYGVFKLDRNGILTRIAGNTGEGYSGDGGPAIDAQFRLSNFDDEPGLPGIVVGGDDVYIADAGNNRLRMLSAYNGTITTIAGNGTSGSAGDGGLAATAQLEYPTSLATQGVNLYIYMMSGDRIRRVFISEGSRHISTVAMAAPGSVLAADNAGLYVAGGGSVRKFAWPNIEIGGEFTTIAVEDGLAMAVDDSGIVYLAQGGRVRKIVPAGAITTVAGNGTCGYSGDGGPATRAQVCANGIAVDREGNLYLADAQSHVIRKISASGVISTVAGNGACCYSGDEGPATNAQLNLAPWGGSMAVDGGGNVYVADAANQRVRKVSPTGIIITVAGNGISNGYSGDGGPATNAPLNFPSSVVVDSQGNLYIADTGNQRIRKVSPTGVISTIVQAFGRALAVDKADNLYFADDGGVHKIAPSGTLTTLTTTPLNLPFAAAVDEAGNYYAAEIGNRSYRVRKITADGVVTTVAGGDGTAGYSGDGGPAAAANLNGPAGLAVDRAGNLYIADSFNGRIRMVTPSGVITTVAGNGSSGYSGDGGLATNAGLGSLSGLAADSFGNLYAADQYYNSIRLLQPLGSSPVVTGAANAASNVGGAIAPGELIIVTGIGLGPGQLVSAIPDDDGHYPTQVAGTSVLINGVPSSLIYASATQVAAIVPDSVPVGTAQLTVRFQGQSSFAIPVPVVPFAPGIFTAGSTGRGSAASVNQDGALNALGDGGDVITVFVTGTGRATSGIIQFYPDSSLQILIPISAGDFQPSSTGVTQIKIQIPPGADCGVPIGLQVGTASSQPGVFLPIRLCI